MGFFDRLETFSDRFVRAIDPAAGNRRAAARSRYRYAKSVEKAIEDRRRRRERRYGSGGFASAEMSEDAHSWLKSRYSPQADLEEAREEMLERADSAVKNYELGVAHVEGRVVRVVGCGTALDPDIEADEEDGIAQEQAAKWNRRLRRDWERQIERIGKKNQPLWRVQQLMQRHAERHGEWFVLIGDKEDRLAPTTLKVEVIHPKRVETPPEKSGDEYCRCGVQFNEDWDVIGYWVRNTHPGDAFELDTKHEFYEAYYPNGLPRVIHSYDETEAGVHRGAPRMQVGLKRLKNSEEYAEAETERNYANACVTAFVTTDIDPDDVVAGDAVDSSGQRVREMMPGQVQHLGEGDDVKISNPSGAPTTFEKFMRYQAQMFAVGCGTSYEVLANDFRGVPYNAGRMLWNIEEGVVAVEHKGQAGTVYVIYQHFVLREHLAGRIDVDPGAFRSQPWLYMAARVIPPARPSIDPAREDRNELVMAEAAIKPASDLVERKNGVPADKVYRRVQKDREMRRRFELDEHMPLMARDDVESDRPSTQPGDANPESSDASTEPMAA